MLEAGSFQEIRWAGGEKTRYVKIEYSADNGSTYRKIAERAANIGVSPWGVPTEASGSCLVRISDAEGAPTLPVVISFEFNFRISTLGGEIPEGEEHFVFRAGVPDPKTQTYQVAEIAFAPDGLKGTENLLFNHAVWEIQGSEAFLGRWHRARIVYDMTRYSGSVWIDGEPVLFGVPLQPDLNVQDRPEISLTRGASVPIGLWIDDVEVGFEDASLTGKDPSKLESRRLFRDNFNRYENALFPHEGGWRAEGGEARQVGTLKAEAAVEGILASKAEETGDRPARSEVDDRVYASSSRSFRLEASNEKPGKAAKRFSLPERVPYSVSRESFSIVPAGEAGQIARGIAPKEDRSDPDERQKRWDGGGTGGSRPRADKKESGGLRPATAGRAPKPDGTGAKTMSGAPATGTFYIYAFDGRLLAEYDVNGQIVREYIYFAGMLVAEYRNQESRLLYYASDQINSTRIVTDNLGNVVYSAAHEPYGGIQKTWVSSYDPALKFSGKERDAESDLDYFGARYYDRTSYRFLTTDPISYRNPGLSPQLLNLYSYSRGNPISYIDLNGCYPVTITIVRTGIAPNGGIMGTFTLETPWETLTGHTLERPYLGSDLARTADSGSAIEAGTYSGEIVRGAVFGNNPPVDAILLSNDELLGTRSGIYIHNGTTIDDSTGCILVGFSQDPTSGDLSNPARQAMIDAMSAAEIGVPSPVVNVMVGFASLLSIADFPEITVNISWDPNFIARVVSNALFSINHVI